MTADRWMEGSYLSSQKLIDGFAKVLRRHYPAQTRIRRAGEAINVKMDKLGYDVVPCFSLTADYRNEPPFYVIPDGKNGWIHTNPRIDNEVSERLQRFNDKTFRPAVKLLKWWNVSHGECDQEYGREGTKPQAARADDSHWSGEGRRSA